MPYFKYISHVQTSSLFLDRSQPSSHLDMNLILLWLFSTCRFTGNESAPLPLPDQGPAVTVLWLQQPAIPWGPFGYFHALFSLCVSSLSQVSCGDICPKPAPHQPASGLSCAPASLQALEFFFFFVLPFILALRFPLW